jgi:hypothetical protein
MAMSIAKKGAVAISIAKYTGTINSTSGPSGHPQEAQSFRILCVGAVHPWMDRAFGG